MVAIIDYDAGNVMSVLRACEAVGADAVISKDADVVSHASHVILPGQGAFGDAMEHIGDAGLISAISDVITSGTPFLGICLGLQLLFDSSEESPGAAGLKLISGRIKRIPDTGLKIPHVGWNSLSLSGDGRMFKDIPDESYVYFVHSYYLEAEDKGVVKAVTHYGTDIHAAVERDNIFAVQFHPEKSSETGLKMLSNFLEIR